MAEVKKIRVLIDDIAALVDKKLTDVYHVRFGAVEYFSRAENGEYAAVIDGTRYGPYDSAGVYDFMGAGPQFVREVEDDG